MRFSASWNTRTSLTASRSIPDLLPSAIEEVLRYRSPVLWMMRTPKRDVEMHGRVIPAGKLVLPMIGSANRDPKQFRDAGRFDIGRDPNPHIAFGHGIHSCLGAAALAPGGADRAVRSAGASQGPEARER